MYKPSASQSLSGKILTFTAKELTDNKKRQLWPQQDLEA